MKVRRVDVKDRKILRDDELDKVVGGKDAAGSGQNVKTVIPIIFGQIQILPPVIPVPGVPADGANEKNAEQKTGDADCLNEPITQR